MLRIVTGKITTILRSLMKPIEYASTKAPPNAAHKSAATKAKRNTARASATAKASPKATHGSESTKDQRSTKEKGSESAHKFVETDEEFDQRYIEYFDRCEIDGWEIRKAMNDLLGMDLVPDPKIIIAGLHACRRVNDIALAIRWIEGCKNSFGSETAKIYPYLMNEILPTMKELHIPTLEELNYDQPELALQSVFEM